MQQAQAPPKSSINPPSHPIAGVILRMISASTDDILLAPKKSKLLFAVHLRQKRLLDRLGMILGHTFRRLLNLVTGGPFRLVLRRETDSFLLIGYKGAKPTTLQTVIAKNKQLAVLSTLDYRNWDTQVAVPLSKLKEVRLALQFASTDSVEVEISPEVACLQSIDVPCDFEIRYDWSLADACVKRNICSGAAYFGSGWFMNDSAYWQLAGITEEFDEWIKNEKFEGQKIIELLTSFIPEARKRGVPLTSALTYCTGPALNLSVEQVDDEKVVLLVKWVDDPASMTPIPSLPGSLLCGEVIRPGIAPEVLTPGASNRQQSLALTGEQIPHFIVQVWPSVQQYASGKCDELVRQHKIIERPGDLRLSITRVLKEGIGIVTATPFFVCGPISIPAAELTKGWNEDTRFIRMPGGWLSIMTVKSAGIERDSRTKDWTPLAPSTLSVSEILQHDSDRFADTWSAVEWPKLEFPKGPCAEDTAKLHLEFLRTWGIPGGVIGGIESYHRAFLSSFLALLADLPGGRVLVVASKRTLDLLGSDWQTVTTCRFDGLRKDPEFRSSLQGLVLATPKALETMPGLAAVPWTVLCIFELDALVKTGNSRLFETLVACRRVLTLGSFASREFLDRNAQKEAISQVFSFSSRRDAELVWRYGLRDPDDPVPTMPSAHRPSSSAAGLRVAEYAVGGAYAIPASPIPVRSASGNIPRSAVNIGVSIEISYPRGADHFVSEARRLVSNRVERAAFVPFMCYWPTYASMTEPQLQWYFYWRDRVRGSQYPDTDLSYIFLHVYELIHGIGARDQQDAYQQLYLLWTKYRQRFPKLDNYLPDWISDYVIVNKLPVDPLQPYLDALSSPNRKCADLLLTQHFGDQLAKVPPSLLNCFSDYQIDRSKFYIEGNAKLIHEKLPKAIDHVDQHLRDKSGKGILETFRPRTTINIQRDPFQSAVYAGPHVQVILGSAYPYSEHIPFREFITALIKHAENRLRQVRQYRARLRGFTLPVDIQAALDEILMGRQEAVAKDIAVPVKVTIDVSRVQELITESDSLREILLAGSEQQEAIPGQRISMRPSEVLPIQKIPRPPGTPKHLLTDLDPVWAVLTRLDLHEKRLLRQLLERQWEVSTEILQRDVPEILVESAIEHINELALKFVGDLLIASEADAKVTTEDYRDELEYLLLHYQQPGLEAEQTKAPSDLPPEWCEFRARLAKHQFEALKVITVGGERSELVRIATENATMPESLVEAINELALDAIGDMIIEPRSDPPLIEDEDMDMVRKLVLSVN